MAITLNELYKLVDKIITEELQKYSTLEKTIHGYEYLIAYPDKRGNETKEGLEKWLDADKANRELIFVKTSLEAKNALKSFR